MMPAIAPAISAALSKSKGKGSAKNGVVKAMVKAKKKISPLPEAKQPSSEKNGMMDKLRTPTLPSALPMIQGYMQQAGMAPQKNY